MIAPRDVANCIITTRRSAAETPSRRGKPYDRLHSTRATLGSAGGRLHFAESHFSFSSIIIALAPQRLRFARARHPAAPPRGKPPVASVLGARVRRDHARKAVPARSGQAVEGSFRSKAAPEVVKPRFFLHGNLSALLGKKLLLVGAEHRLGCGVSAPESPSVPITPRLFQKLQQTLGEEAGAEFMTWMHRVDARVADTATRADLAELREATRADIAELRHEMQVGFAKMHEEMAGLETRFERRYGDLIKWSFVFWVGAVGAIAMLAGVLR